MIHSIWVESVGKQQSIRTIRSYQPLGRPSAPDPNIQDGTGREEGGGFRMGNTCIPVADSF